MESVNIITLSDILQYNMQSKMKKPRLLDGVRTLKRLFRVHRRGVHLLD